MLADQRPYISPNDLGSPRFFMTPNNGGQVVWSYQFHNYGRGLAKDVSFRQFIKVGDEHYQPSYGSTGPSKASPIPGSKIVFATVVSRPGFSQEEFNRFLGVDGGIGILIQFHYFGTVSKTEFEDTFCLQRLASGAIAYRQPEECPK
jgi:hypothetical protein